VDSRHCVAHHLTLAEMRTSPPTLLVRKLWQYCNVLRDDGLSYPDYVEQLTYLLFLKMSDESATDPVPSEYGWRSLVHLEPARMHLQYGEILAKLGARSGMLGLIFRNAKNKIRDPAKLHLLVTGLIGQTEWTGLAADVKGDAYEGLLEKNAQDTKSGAGQYFTPRPLIEAMVECIAPRLGETICDPACGTGGFLLAAYEHVRRENEHMTPAEEIELKTKSIRGVELVEEVARLAAMNLLLHGVCGDAKDEFPVICEDSLARSPRRRFDIVLTNPPFGTKGSVTYGRESNSVRKRLAVDRPDFWVHTANKQLNFIQHILSLLKPGGRAAIVVPENVLFEGGAAATIRRQLLRTCRLRAVLRLPPGIFYAQSVKSNVLFFDQAHDATRRRAVGQFSVYDLRTNVRVSLRTNPLQSENLCEFVTLYRSNFAGNTANESRFRSFGAREVLATDGCQLDLTWAGELTPHRAGLARLEQISALVADDVKRALALIEDVRGSTK